MATAQRRSTPVIRPMRARPYRERRALLDELGPRGRSWQTPPVWFGGGPDVFAASRDRGLEGVVAKRVASTCRPGARSREARIPHPHRDRRLRPTTHGHGDSDIEPHGGGGSGFLFGRRDAR